MIAATPPTASRPNRFSLRDLVTSCVAEGLETPAFHAARPDRTDPSTRHSKAGKLYILGGYLSLMQRFIATEGPALEAAGVSADSFERAMSTIFMRTLGPACPITDPMVERTFKDNIRPADRADELWSFQQRQIGGYTTQLHQVKTMTWNGEPRIPVAIIGHYAETLRSEQQRLAEAVKTEANPS